MKPILWCVALFTILLSACTNHPLSVAAPSPEPMPGPVITEPGDPTMNTEMCLWRDDQVFKYWQAGGAIPTITYLADRMDRGVFISDIPDYETNRPYTIYDYRGSGPGGKWCKRVDGAYGSRTAPLVISNQYQSQ